MMAMLEDPGSGKEAGEDPANSFLVRLVNAIIIRLTDLFTFTSTVLTGEFTTSVNVKTAITPEKTLARNT